MNPHQHPLDWVAPLLVGASAAIMAEVAISVLIYAGDGFVRSLTTVLAVEGMALGVGLWSAPAPGPTVVERLRRRWMTCVTSFLAATAFGVTWSLVPDLVSGATGQALGLTLLAAVPLFTCGTVLGGMSSVTRAVPPGTLREPGAAAALGAGIGFVFTGFFLPRAPVPASLIVACLVLLSAGGLVYGVVLSAQDPDGEEEEPAVATTPVLDMASAETDQIASLGGESRAT